MTILVILQSELRKGMTAWTLDEDKKSSLMSSSDSLFSLVDTLKKTYPKEFRGSGNSVIIPSDYRISGEGQDIIMLNMILKIALNELGCRIVMFTRDIEEETSLQHQSETNDDKKEQ